MINKSRERKMKPFIERSMKFYGKSYQKEPMDFERMRKSVSDEILRSFKNAPSPKGHEVLEKWIKGLRMGLAMDMLFQHYGIEEHGENIISNAPRQLTDDLLVITTSFFKLPRRLQNRS